MSGSLTLSHVEQASVLAHLDTHYVRLCKEKGSHPDCPVLHRLHVKVGEGRVVQMTVLETYVMQRALRAQHLLMIEDMRALEERRLRGGVNGGVAGAWLALDAESTILADVIRRVWALI